MRTVDVIFFDLETQFLFHDLGMIDRRQQDPSRLKLAIAGTLVNDTHSFFTEDDVSELLRCLKKADMIVGHNLIRFDYPVLLPYIGEDSIRALLPKTFDTWADLEKLTGCWLGLDDLCKRNLGMSKTANAQEIPKLWRDGEREKVKCYLLNDLKMVEALFNVGRTTRKIKYDHKEYGKSLGEKDIAVAWHDPQIGI